MDKIQQFEMGHFEYSASGRLFPLRAEAERRSFRRGAVVVINQPRIRGIGVVDHDVCAGDRSTFTEVDLLAGNVAPAIGLLELG